MSRVEPAANVTFVLPAAIVPPFRSTAPLTTSLLLPLPPSATAPPVTLSVPLIRSALLFDPNVNVPPVTVTVAPELIARVLGAVAGVVLTTGWFAGALGIVAVSFAFAPGMPLPHELQ